MAPDSPFLSGLTVAQIGSTVTASAAGALLRVLGADVTIYSGMQDPNQGLRTHEIEVLAVLELGSTIELVDDLFAHKTIADTANSDIIIADLSSVRKVIDDSFVTDYLETVGRLNTSSWVTVSAFGIQSTMRNYRATELTASASGGIPFYIRNRSRRPMKPAGYTASIAAGHIAAVAGLHGLYRTGNGSPIHHDLSMQDSVISTGVFLECAHALFKSPGKSGMGRYAAPRGYFKCLDGHFFIVVLEDHQWAGVVEALRRPEWAMGIVSNQDRLNNSDLIEDRIRSWAASRTAEECAETLQSNGVPASPLNSCGDLLTATDFVEGGFLMPTGRDEEVIPGLPAELTQYTPASDLEDARSQGPPRILDIGNVLAGPLATSWLGTMGMEVLKVEDVSRLDIYRRRGPFIEGGQDIEHGAYFAAANYSKQSCCLDLESLEGRQQLSELISQSDFVVENLSSSRAERLGLTPSAAEAIGATLISSSGFGRNSTRGHYRAYGQIIHSYGGITYHTRDEEGEFRPLGTSWADPLTSVWICALTLAQLLAPKSVRSHVDISMVKVVARQLPEYFARASRGQPTMEDIQNRLAGYAPHGIYRCRGNDNWLALAISDDDEWRDLTDVLTDPRLEAAVYATAEGRLAGQESLDELLDEVFGRMDVDLMFQQLQARGVACAPVLGAPTLAESTHLRERGLIQMVAHPVWGSREMIGLPWRVVREGPLPISPPPTLGNVQGYRSAQRI